jgi:hypothetical protein
MCNGGNVGEEGTNKQTLTWMHSHQHFDYEVILIELCRIEGQYTIKDRIDGLALRECVFYKADVALYGDRM